jgi:hypothetical protein
MKDKLDRIKECLTEINEAQFHESVWCEIDDMVKLVPELIYQYEKYEKALKFYAEKENYEAWEEYEDATGFFNNVDCDGGDKARSMLEKEGK